jgi:hypothetical protein
VDLGPTSAGYRAICNLYVCPPWPNMAAQKILIPRQPNRGLDRFTTFNNASSILVCQPGPCALK